MWWLGSILSGAALILLSRWALRVARPQEDIGAVERVVWSMSEVVIDAWHSIWRAYGPITEDMRATWAQLRARYQGGGYGTEGT